MAPLPFAFAFLTWRESIVGMKPTELVTMDIRRTWDSVPVSSSGSQGGQTLGGTVMSETMGNVRWRMTDEPMFGKTLRHLATRGLDMRSGVVATEDVWTEADGTIVRQREVRATAKGQETGEATFYPDRIELTRTDAQGRSTFAEVNPSGGMAAVQARFKSMTGDRKEFLRLDAIRGGFVRVTVERTGRFKGEWGGDAYEGSAYRFTVDGKAQRAMMTAEDEIVRIEFNPTLALVLGGPTRSRRAPGSKDAASPTDRVKRRLAPPKNGPPPFSARTHRLTALLGGGRFDRSRA